MIRISIVTAAYNMEQWVSRTIESIISQEGDFEIEYILQDGASKDRTVEIFNTYKTKVESGAWPVRCKKITLSSLSEKDEGMYDAVNKGFMRATGDVYAWADADNTFEPGAFAAIAKTFVSFPETQWVIAAGDNMNEKWEKTNRGLCLMYRQDWLRNGIYGREAYYVVQNACMWRRELWQKIGAIPSSFKTAGDYWLWMEMAKHAAPLSLNAHVSNFMKREGQLHTDGRYKKEQLAARPRRPLSAWLAKAFFVPYNHTPKSLQPFAASLYPLFFPFHSRSYVSLENGKPILRNMPSFFVR
jgi:glycosyltransferase involved in cell wall biosynthesis